MMRVMGNVAWLAEDEEAINKRPGPEFDSARDSLKNTLAEKPRSSASADGNFGWLEGLRVLDLTNVIAGPTIGSTLARFGAKVTLVQPVEPSVDPWNTTVFGIQAQRGKESILLNLSTPDGRRVLDQLIETVDVITFNGTDEQRDKLGLTTTQLLSINPRLILVQLDAFGGPLRGPKSDHLGYDDLAQAATGVMRRFGGGMETPEEHAHFGTIDVLAGFCACVALGGALQRLEHTGKGGVARASLAAAGNLIQTLFMYDYQGRKSFDEPSGREALGWGPFYHCYEAADGWMFYSGIKDRQDIYATIPELAHLAEESEQKLTASLTEVFKARKIEYWQQVFKGTSSIVVSMGSLHQTRDAARQIESGGDIDISNATYRVIRHDQHPMGRWCDLVAPNAVRPQKAKITIPTPMPKYGAHTREILGRLGYADNEIQTMLTNGTAGLEWSEKYLPE